MTTATNRQPLAKGTQIEYCEMNAIVVKDDGGDRIVVNCEGSIQRWWWTFEEKSCELVSQELTQSN